jgi:hypothetical protein
VPKDQFVCTANNKKFRLFVDERFLAPGAWAIHQNYLLKEAKFVAKGRSIVLYDVMCDAHPDAADSNPPEEVYFSEMEHEEAAAAAKAAGAAPATAAGLPAGSGGAHAKAPQPPPRR